MSKNYVCPICRKIMEVTQVERVREETSYGNSWWYRVSLECMTCPTILCVVIDVPTADALPPGHELPEEVEIVGYDNRDTNTTWLWISPTKYVEVDPTDLYNTMLDNRSNPDVAGSDI